MSEQSEAEYAYFMLLVGMARECDHPPQYRHPPTPRSYDPSEWRCGVCGTEQIRLRAAAKEAERE